ncbi:MAG: cytochrome P450 [Bacteroidota bacterium]
MPPSAPLHRSRALLGSRRALLRDPARFYADVAWQHGGLARFRVAHRILHAVAHPDLLHEILVTKASTYVKGSAYRNLAQVIGEGLVVLDGEDWRADHRIIRPGLHKRALSGMVATVNAACDEAFRRWDAETKAYHPVVGPLRLIALHVIGEALLGTTLQALQRARLSEQAMEAMHLLTRKNWSLLPLPERWPTPLNRRLQRIRLSMLRFLEAQVERRLQSGLGDRGDVLDLLLLNHLSDQEPRLSRRRVLHELLTLFVAGYDTTSSALAWSLYYLAQHPKVLAAVQTEVDAVLGPRPPTWEDVPKLTAVGRVFEEALRLNPPIHTLIRESTAPDTLGGYHVPAGSLVFLSLYGANRSPVHWADPNRFRPERFTTHSGPRYDPRACVPFGAGPRRCLGALFGTVEAKVVLARVVQRYRFALQPGHLVRSALGTAMYPENLFLQFTPHPTRISA